MWTFDQTRHAVTDGALERRLEPKAAAVLAALIRADGRVVTKEELLDAAWADRYVTGEVLTNAIYQIRKALDDDAREPRCIETIAKRGYRLLVPIAMDEPVGSPRRARRRWIAAVLAGLALGTAGGLLADRWMDDAAPRASDLVTRGWNVLETSGSDGAGEAAVLAREALTLDAADPDAWALAAAAWAGRAAHGDLEDATVGYASALDAADRALGLSPGHPRALGARARARWLGSWDWTGAESDLIAALEREPDSAALWADLAELRFFSGRIDEARDAVRRALDRDPASVRARMTAGLVATFAGEADEAERQYRALLARRPGHAAASRQLAKLGRTVETRSAGERLEGLAAKERLRPAHLALWHLEAGDEDVALDWLERAVELKDPTILFFRFDPRWDPLRNHPRYRAAMRQVDSRPA